MALKLAAILLSFIPFISGLQFVAIGDWGDNTASGIAMQKVVAQRLSEWCEINTCEFILGMGDNFYPQGVVSVTDSRFDSSWTEIYHIYPSIADKVWYQSIGNHDHDASPPGDSREWNQVLYGLTEPRWYFPNRWYDFVFDDPDGYSVHFFIIDSQSLRYNTNSPAAQLNWFQQALADSTSEWKVVVVHHPPYTVGGYGPGSSTIDTQIVPIAKRYGVHLMFSGHDHNLQHIVNATNANDIHYVITAGGGRGLYNINNDAANTLRQRGFEIPYFGYTNGFTDLDFSATDVTVRHIDPNGNVVHTFTRSVDTSQAAAAAAKVDVAAAFRSFLNEKHGEY